MRLTKAVALRGTMTLAAAALVAAFVAVTAIGPPASALTDPSVPEGEDPSPLIRTAAVTRPTIQGVGASFPQIEIEQWRADVKRLFDLNVNYTALGSGAGRQQFISNQGDFSVSDIQFLSGEQNLVKRAFVYVPISAGGLAMMYHLKDAAGQLVKDLRLTPETICKIYAGQITNWNDPAITGPTGRALKDLPITPVHRADAAGTSFVLGEYCLEQAPAVYNKLLDDYDRLNPRNPTVRPLTENWPRINGFSSDGSNGIADAVAAPDGEGRITAVEFGFAKIRRFPAAAVRNASGVFVQPTEANVTRALQFAEVRPNGTHQLHFNGAGNDVYFPSSYSYAIAPTTIDPEKGFVLASYLNYAVTKGQEKANALGYAALSANLVKAGLDAIAKIAGAPPRPADVDFNPVDGAGPGAGGGPAAAGPSGGGAGGGVAAGAGAGAGGSTPAAAAAAGGGSGGTAARTGGTGTGTTGTGTTRTAAGTPRISTGAAGSSTRTGSSVGGGAASGTSGALNAVGTGIGTGVDPSVDLAVGAFGATGGEQAIEAGLGMLLVAGGEALRRRAWSGRRSRRRRAGMAAASGGRR